MRIDSRGDKYLHQERGNFLLQAMLALGVIFAFIPFLARQLADRNIDARMYSSTRQIEIAQTAARIFIRENANNLPYDTTVVSGDEFSDLLEPYGLPLGFVPRTALGQDIALVIHKTPVAVSAYLEMTGGNLREIDYAELARRIGFYAAQTDSGVNVGIELTDIYSDVVRRDEPNLDAGGFLTDLDMGGFTLNNVGNLFAVRGVFPTADFNTLSVVGIESGKDAKNNIARITANKTVFQSAGGESALTLTRGTLFTDALSVRTISLFGDTGAFAVGDVSVHDFALTAGYTSFTGGGQWNIGGNVVSNNINFSVERLDISSYLVTTRGQDVFIDEDTLKYNTKSGIDVDTIYTSNITMRDQTSSGLSDGKSGAVILDIRPSGTTLLPDVYVSDINNDSFEIIAEPSADNDKTIDCETLIKKYDGVYNKQSLSQYLICQYVYWQRLEKRIDIKQCIMAGRSECN